MTHSAAVLYRDHARRVFRQVARVVGPTSECEDLVQDVFLEVCRAIPHFRGESEIGTFIHRIASNVAIDHLRRRRRQPQNDAHVDDLHLRDAGRTPEEQAHQRGELARVMAQLAQLEPAKRLALALVAIGELSHKEAAERVAASPDLVKQRVHRARSELLAMRGGSGRRPR